MTSWDDVLKTEKQKPYFKSIIEYVKQERTKGKSVFPPANEVFNALKLTPFNEVKVVILGQDPYHGEGQAHGLSFSVKNGIRKPPSLKNIFKELRSDLNIEEPLHGCLENWAKQGVLLLNATLTVEAHQPQSHSKIGWQQFTDTVIAALNQHDTPIVFLLWGSYAQKKAALIDSKKHFILTAPHPSPLSAHRGFLGCKHFSKVNELLVKAGRSPINW